MQTLKKYLMSHGAALVGFAELEGCYLIDAQNPDMPRLPCGVAIAVAIPREVVLGIHDGPTRAYFNAYHELNRKLDGLAQLCEAYLRRRGYQAYAQTTQRIHAAQSGNITVLPHKTVARLGGLGWIGKSALLVTPQYGSAIRLASVVTDAPLDCDTPLDNRCGGCMLCTNACPGKAITGRLWELGKEREWIFNPIKCRTKARELSAKALDEQITLCGKCIETCPHTKRYLQSAQLPQGVYRA